MIEDRKFFGYHDLVEIKNFSRAIAGSEASDRYFFADGTVLLSISASMSESFQAVILPILTGAGNRPDLTPATQVDLPIGMIPALGGLDFLSPIISLSLKSCTNDSLHKTVDLLLRLDLIEFLWTRMISD